jgi:AcrR family transcriptional regulator
MHADQSYVRAPKQERSRMSFERAVDAAVALLVERKSDSFTLAEVAERGGVSIGSIYGRVDSKDDLLRAAHAREMSRIMAEQDAAFATLTRQEEPLADTVARVILTMATVLRTNAPVLAPFMELSKHDPAIAKTGQAAHAGLVRSVQDALLTRRSEIRNRNPERAVNFSFTVAFSVVSLWLGLGDVGETGYEGKWAEGEWDEILADLSEMITAFLRG